MGAGSCYDGGGGVVAGEGEDEEALGRLWERLAPELRQLLAQRQNFKVVINCAAGHSFAVEVIKTLRF